MSSPGMEPCGLGVRLLTDPAGRSEVPARPNLFVAIHVGRSVEMVCERAGQKYRGKLVHGDIDIVPAGTPSIWEPKSADTALILSLTPHLLSQAAEDSGIHSDQIEFRNRFAIRDAQIENIGWALKAEIENGYGGGRLLMDSLATALASCLVARHSSAAQPSAASNGRLSGVRLRRVLSHIEENLVGDLPLGAIAEVAGVSASHFKIIFRETIGVPVHQYVIQRRVERAKSLLRDASLSVSQVAQESGFAHQSHLATHMRRLLGATPREFRAATQ